MLMAKHRILAWARSQDVWHRAWVVAVVEACCHLQAWEEEVEYQAGPSCLALVAEEVESYQEQTRACQVEVVVEAEYYH